MRKWRRKLRMAEIRALLFDMDGVILDSNPLHRESWTEYNRRQGVETTEESMLGMYGKRNDMLVRDFLGQGLTDAEVKAHGHAKEALYREMMRPRIQEFLVPGLEAFLRVHAGIPKAVVSNAEPANVEFTLREANLRHYFRFTLDGSQVKNPKPHPEIYLKAAEMLGVEPRECVVFEDSHGGVTAGVAAGMRVVGITTTFAELPGASLLVRDFRDPGLGEWLGRK